MSNIFGGFATILCWWLLDQIYIEHEYRLLFSLGAGLIACGMLSMIIDEYVREMFDLYKKGDL